MQDLNITLIQTNIHWEAPDANRAEVEELFSEATLPADLVVLPEMFTTGFSMDAQSIAEPMNLHTFKWMKQMAERSGACWAGTYPVREGKFVYNRFLWMFPDGQFGYYDKKHLFAPGEENLNYRAGHKQVLIEWKGWKIAPFVCYDLRFPVWSRRRAQDYNYDVAVYSANWPASRSHVWNTLLQARAIENAAYCLGINRVGKDGRDIEYSGNSCVVNYKGEVMTKAAGEQALLQTTLSKNDLEEFRLKFPVQNDADGFVLL